MTTAPNACRCLWSYLLRPKLLEYIHIHRSSWAVILFLSILWETIHPAPYTQQDRSKDKSYLAPNSSLPFSSDLSILWPTALPAWGWVSCTLPAAWLAPSGFREPALPITKPHCLCFLQHWPQSSTFDLSDNVHTSLYEVEDPSEQDHACFIKALAIC